MFVQLFVLPSASRLLTFVYFSVRRGRGRPKKVKGRGKGRPNRGFYSVKHGTQGAAKVVRRVAARSARLCLAREANNEPLPLTEKKLQQAVTVACLRQFPGASRKEWPAISAAMTKQFRDEPRTCRHVLEKINQRESPEDRRPGGGRKSRISPGTEKADRLVGGLLNGFGARHTAHFVNQCGVSPGKKPLHRTTVLRVAKSKVSSNFVFGAPNFAHKTN